MTEEKKDQKADPYCFVCGKRGGKLQTDPFEEDIHGRVVKIRLHDGVCLQERRDEI